MINRVNAESLFVSALVAKQPKVIKSYIKNHRYTWIVSLPLDITMQNKTSKASRQLKLIFEIQRSPDKVTPNGIAITNLTISN